MKELKIGNILAERRSRKGVTQEEVAEYIGVSKASVSKWENGLSYPDITILPLLATYYNMSIDALLGYRPQLEDREIQRKYREFSGKFAEQPFHKVVEEVRSFIHNYDSCYQLLFFMAQLFLNNFMLAASQKEGEMVLEEAKELCRRITAESEDTLLKKDALSLEAMISLMRKEPEEVFALLGNKLRPLLPGDLFVINAYYMIGEKDQAMEYTQAMLYQYILTSIDIMGMYFTLCKEEQKEECLKRIRKFADAFDMAQLLPHKMVNVHYAEMVHYAGCGEEEKVLESFLDYVHLIEREWKNFSIHGDKFFDKLDEWAQDVGLANDMPRDKRLVGRDLVAGVTKNPLFDSLRENPEFQKLENRLKKTLDKSNGGKI